MRQERLYFFQFPQPFPVFQSRHATQNADVKGKGRAEPGTGDDATKKVTFAEDTKPPAAQQSSEKAAEAAKVDVGLGHANVGEEQPGSEDGLGEDVEDSVSNDLLVDIHLAGAISDTPDAVIMSVFESWLLIEEGLTLGRQSR